MKFIELIPLKGILLDGEPIDFGFTRAELERALGAPESALKPDRFNPNTRLYYFESSICFELDADRLIFIDFLGGVDGRLRPMIYGENVFEADADKLAQLLKSKNGGMADSANAPYDYTFSQISVGVFRERIPSEVERMISEAALGDFPLNAEECIYERRLAYHWNSIGIGVDGYYGK